MADELRPRPCLRCGDLVTEKDLRVPPIPFCIRCIDDRVVLGQEWVLIAVLAVKDLVPLGRALGRHVVITLVGGERLSFVAAAEHAAQHARLAELLIRT